MFSFRRDKVGFFVTLILILIAVGTFINTLVLVVVGLAQGNWTMYSLPMKIVLASAWVLCIATVLTRVAIFRMQMLRAERARQAAQAVHGESGGAAGGSSPPFEVARPLPPPLPPPEASHEGSAGADSSSSRPLPRGDRPEPA
jgi:hypothetical protein